METRYHPPPGIALAGGDAFGYRLSRISGPRNRTQCHGYAAVRSSNRRLAPGRCLLTRVTSVPMDCKRFRKQHLAYLDDTLPGDEMAAAQHHVMVCDGCAAHDTLVRRSLMVARSMPTLEPSADFQARLRARLAECREECRDERTAMASRTALLDAPRSAASRLAASRNSRVVMAVAASAMLGAFVWQGWSAATAPALSIQPVSASQPTMPTPASYITPELMQAMATGNPVWPAAMIIEDAPTHFVGGDFTLATFAELR